MPGHLRLFSLNGQHRDLASLAPKLALYGAAWDGKRLLYDDAPSDVLKSGLSAIYRLESGSEGSPIIGSGAADGDSLMIQQTLPESKGYLISVHGDHDWIRVLTADGSRKQLVSGARGGIYLPNYSLADGSSIQLTEPSQNPPYACWSPDGRSIVYESNRIGGRESNLFLRPVAGGVQGAKTQLTRFDGGGMVPYAWSRDGKCLVGTRGMLSETKSDIFAIPMSASTAHEPKPVVQTPDYDSNPDLSPDGKWLAYETGTQIFVRPFPGEPGTAAVLAAQGQGVLWDPSGRELYFRRGASVIEIPVRFEPNPQFGAASDLFSTNALGPDLWGARHAACARREPVPDGYRGEGPCSRATT